MTAAYLLLLLRVAMRVGQVMGCQELWIDDHLDGFRNGLSADDEWRQQAI
jgi:hypothetical protein